MPTYTPRPSMSPSPAPAPTTSFIPDPTSIAPDKKPVSGRGLLYNLFSNDEAWQGKQENAAKIY